MLTLLKLDTTLCELNLDEILSNNSTLIEVYKPASIMIHYNLKCLTTKRRASTRKEANLDHNSIDSNHRR